MDLGLAGLTAWVLGASQGLGYAVASTLVAEGAKVAVSARPGRRLDAAVSHLSEHGRASAIPVDLTDSESLSAAFQSVKNQLGDIGVGVFNGGGPPPSRFDELGDKGLDAAYRLLLRPAYQFLNLLGPAMTAHGAGVILYCTSSAVKEPIRHLAASNIMRAGVTALAKTAATELGSRGVRVLCLAPGRFDTERTRQLDEAAAERGQITTDHVAARSIDGIPMGRYGDPCEFGKVAAFLCSDAASYLTGITVVVDGGKLRGVL